MRRSYLLTGASGFVGRYMAEAILRRGDAVVALDREEGHNLPAGVQTSVMDLQDSSSMAGLPRTWDGVIHLAGASIPSHFSTPAPVTFNLGITLNLLEHLRDSRVLLVSSCHVYAPSDQLRREDDPIVPQGLYGLSKHLVEQVAPRYQGALDVRVARPFNHLGPGSRPELMLPSLLQRLASSPTDDEAPVLMNGLNSVRDFIDVRDVVSAYLAILDLEAPAHRTFNVCTGRATSIEDVVQTVLRLQGRSREVHFQGSPNSTDDIPFLVGDPGRLATGASWTAQHSLEDSLRSMMPPPLS
ncbi:MAG: NAD(P)-dependent oxidoreductase [Holophagaceae bacterium]|nr:NAD(P)-dependent oxidoreductase [Holophagaceae bacterium]